MGNRLNEINQFLLLTVLSSQTNSMKTPYILLRKDIIIQRAIWTMKLIVDVALMTTTAFWLIYSAAFFWCPILS